MLREDSAYRDLSKMISRVCQFFCSSTHPLNTYIETNYVSGKVLNAKDTMVKDIDDSCP